MKLAETSEKLAFFWFILENDEVTSKPTFGLFYLLLYW